MKWITKDSIRDILDALRFTLIKLKTALKNQEANFDPDPEIDPATRPMNQEPVPPTVPAPPKKEPWQIITEAATKAQGLDLTPDDKVPDEVACVVQIVAVLRGTGYDLPENLKHTDPLKKALDKHPKWRGTLEPKAGNIVVTVTEGENHGHCGIFITKDLIMSNNSFGALKGKWTQNYQWRNWIAYYKYNKGLRIYIFEPV